MRAEINKIKVLATSEQLKIVFILLPNDVKIHFTSRIFPTSTSHQVSCWLIEISERDKMHASSIVSLSNDLVIPSLFFFSSIPNLGCGFSD
jgi:hypothetical protein